MLRQKKSFLREEKRSRDLVIKNLLASYKQRQAQIARIRRGKFDPALDQMSTHRLIRDFQEQPELNLAVDAIAEGASPNAADLCDSLDTTAYYSREQFSRELGGRT